VKLHKHEYISLHIDELRIMIKLKACRQKKKYNNKNKNNDKIVIVITTLLKGCSSICREFTNLYWNLCIKRVITTNRRASLKIF
jgi:hypothetical protein